MGSLLAFSGGDATCTPRFVNDCGDCPAYHEAGLDPLQRAEGLIQGSVQHWLRLASVALGSAVE